MVSSVFSAVTSEATPLTSERERLSLLSTDAQQDFLQSQGVVVPQAYSEYITSLIARIEENPDHPIVISNPVTYKLSLQVKNAVNNYYQRNIAQIPWTAVTYTLQDSTVYGNWSDSFLYYNCYAYSVGRTDSFYWPGKFSNVPNPDNFDITDSISSLASDVKDDLKSVSFSNKCVTITSTRPTSFVREVMYLHTKGKC